MIKFLQDLFFFRIYRPEIANRLHENQNALQELKKTCDFSNLPH